VVVKSELVEQVRAFVRWVGTGRKLTQTGRITMDDATEFQLGLWRRCNDRDAKLVLDVLRRLGAVTIEDETAALTDLGRSGMRVLLDEPEPGDPVYQLRITLMGADNPPVWRRVLVPAAIRLDRLHEVVQAAMGWQNAHLHVFGDGQTYYGVPDPELGFHDEHVKKLNDLVAPGGRIEYTYDFGDSWDHEILADPGHEEHQFMLDWLGLDSRDQFDPAHFDPDDADRRLAVVSDAGFITSGH
jgi:hypothetical protein